MCESDVLLVCLVKLGSAQQSHQPLASLPHPPKVSTDRAPVPVHVPMQDRGTLDRCCVCTVVGVIGRIVNVTSTAPGSHRRRKDIDRDLDSRHPRRPEPWQHRSDPCALQAMAVSNHSVTTAIVLTSLPRYTRGMKRHRNCSRKSHRIDRAHARHHLSYSSSVTMSGHTRVYRYICEARLEYDASLPMPLCSRHTTD